MSIDVGETIESQAAQLSQNPWDKRIYWAKGSTVRADILTAVAAVAPATVTVGSSTLPQQTYDIEPRDKGEDFWTVTVGYALRTYRGPPTSGNSVFSFDTTGGTQHITQAKEHISSFVASGTAPDHKGAIGVTRDAVEGADIVVPIYKWSETHVVADSDIATLRGNLYALTGRTNNATFLGYNTGEVLFMGATGTRRGSSGNPWDITVNFAASPNVSGVTIGSISSISKKGWEYLWVQYKEDVHSASASMVRVPLAVFVERVYDAGDFSPLAALT